MTTETYSELDRTDLTPVWIGNQERGDGTEYATYNMGETTIGIHVLWERGIEPLCWHCGSRVAYHEDGLCEICEKARVRG